MIPQMIPQMNRPGFAVQPPLVQNQQFIPSGPMIQQSQIPVTQGIPTQSIKYTTAPQQIHHSYTPMVQTAQQYIPQQVMTSQTQVITTGGCPPPVQGQPIVIEGGITGAQAYMEPVRQTVLLQGAQIRPELSQVIKGQSRIEHIPYEQVVTEYDELEKRIRIPINKYITEYQVIDHQVEYHPEISYQTEVDYRPQQRVEEEVQYQTTEKRIDIGFNQSMRTSQRIEGAINVSSPTMIQSSIAPVQTIQTVQQTIPQQTFVSQPQVISTGVTYSQAPVAYTSAIPVQTQQWPTTWNHAYGKRKSS